MRRRVDGAGLASRRPGDAAAGHAAPDRPAALAGGRLEQAGGDDAAGVPGRAKAATTGKRETGIEMSSDGTVAEAAYPVRYQGRVGAVIVYSDPVSDIVRSVHQHYFFHADARFDHVRKYGPNDQGGDGCCNDPTVNSSTTTFLW